MANMIHQKCYTANGLSLGCRFTVQILAAMKFTSVVYNLFYIVHLGVLHLCSKAANKTAICITYVVYRMKDLAVIDSSSGALYPKIVSIANEEVFSLEVC